MDDKAIVPQKFHPLGLDTREVDLCLETYERLVFGEDLYLCNALKVASPFLDSVYYYKEFFVVNSVTLFRGL